MTDVKRRRRRHESPGGNGRETGNDRLGAVLRRGDPDGDGRAPSPAERAALRRLVVDAARSASARAWPPVPAIAAAVVAVVALAVGSLFWIEPAGPGEPPRIAGGADGSGGSPAMAAGGRDAGIAGNGPPAIRNVRFVTSGGTRIVWVLNRNLDI